MNWKTIGESVIGTSHNTAGGTCEDNVRYRVTKDKFGDDVMICVASDGAGSAKYASWASAFATKEGIGILSLISQEPDRVQERDIFGMVEDIYDVLAWEAEQKKVDIHEYSCTLLGCFIAKHKSIFFQIGDGAIVRNDGSDFYTPVWWPHNGEYQNTTAFIVDDRNLANLNILVLDEPVHEVAVFTDGLQMLALNMEDRNAHQPFFADMFRYLRLADDTPKLDILDRKLTEYLESEAVNNRTDDDKTLFLGTRL